jgi:hypothetical protein
MGFLLLFKRFFTSLKVISLRISVHTDFFCEKLAMFEITLTDF